MTRARDVVTASTAAAFIAASCARDAAITLPSLPPPPVIVTDVVAANPANVLSAFVSVRIQRADSVAVRYGTSPTLDSLTPAVTIHSDSAVVPVFGLLDATSYSFRVVAYGGGQEITGDPLELITGLLPGDLPRFVASGSDPSPGFVVFAAGRYGLAIDNGGRVVWYHRFPDGPGLNFQAEPTGHYFARPTTPNPNDKDPWIEIDPLGNTIRTFNCARDLQSRFHDVIVERDGAYWIMCDEVRTMDLSAMGGKTNAQVMGTVIQHVSPNGALLFEWSPFDHFDIADLDPASRSGATVNWTHANSIDLDTDGNLVASFRNLNEITKIDTRTGAVLWRMGGARNQFVFENSQVPPFVFQHALRVTAPGRFLLLDNFGDPSGSRAESYAFDETLRTVRMVGTYGPTPSAISMTGGSAHQLPAGRTLVSLGPAGRVEEYDASGHMVWRIEGNPGYVFRAQRIRSLYNPGLGLAR